MMVLILAVLVFFLLMVIFLDRFQINHTYLKFVLQGYRLM